MTRRTPAFALFLMLLIVACGYSSPTNTALSSVTPSGVHALPTEAENEWVATEVPTSTLLPDTPEPILPISIDNLSAVSPLHILVGHADTVSDVALSSDGAWVVSASLDGALRLWRSVDGVLVYEVSAHADAVRSVDFSPDGTLIVSGSDDRTARLWRVDDGTLVRVIHNDVLGRVLKVAFSPDGNLIAIGGHLCVVELRTTRAGILRRTLTQPFCAARGEGQVEYWGLDFSSDGSQIITGEGRPCCGGSLQRWTVDVYHEPELIRGYDLVVRQAAISPNGDTLAVALVGSTFFWLLDLDGSNPQQVLDGHRLRVNDLTFSPDGELLVSASRDGRIGIWEVATGKLLRYLEGHAGDVTSLDFSSDGSLLASGSEDGSVILWGVP